MPSALVINPWATDFKLYDEWMHPVGLYFLISLLRHNGFAIHYFNCLSRPDSGKTKYGNTGNFCNIEIPKPDIYKSVKRKYKIYGQPAERLEEYLLSISSPDVILIGSGMTYWLHGLVATVFAVKKHFSDIPVIIGGISAQLVPDHIKSAVSGVFVFSGSLFDESLKRQSHIPFISDLETDSWEPSMSDAFPYVKITHHAPVLTSFGCPLSCTYCASKILQKTFFIRKRRTVINEILSANRNYGIHDFAFFDDALLFEPEKNIIPLLESLIDLCSGIRLHTPNGLHVKMLSTNILDLMKQAGFATLRLGYESSDSRYFKDTNSKAGRKILAEKIKTAFDCGFSGSSIGVYIMAGLPGQTPDDVSDEIKFVTSLSVKAKPVFLSPVPHTIMYERYIEMFPWLDKDPLYQNDSFFITALPGWNSDCIQNTMDLAKACNAQIDTK
jgi:hypothetical protein